MLNKGDFFDSLQRIPSEIQKLVEARLELFRIEISLGASKALSNITFTAIGGMVMLTGLGFLALALSFFLNDVFESKYLGFLITGIGFCVISSFFLAGPPRRIREKLEIDIYNKLIDKTELIEGVKQLPSTDKTRSQKE